MRLPPEPDERFADWVDGRMSAAERRAFEREVKRNPDLRAALGRYLDTIEQVQTHGRSEHAPSQLADRVMAAIDAEEAPRTPVAGGGFRWGLWGSLAAAAALVTVTIVLGLDARRPQVRDSARLAPPVADVEIGEPVGADKGTDGAKESGERLASSEAQSDSAEQDARRPARERIATREDERAKTMLEAPSAGGGGTARSSLKDEPSPVAGAAKPQERQAELEQRDALERRRAGVQAGAVGSNEMQPPPSEEPAKASPPQAQPEQGQLAQAPRSGAKQAQPSAGLTAVGPTGAATPPPASTATEAPGVAETGADEFFMGREGGVDRDAGLLQLDDVTTPADVGSLLVVARWPQPTVTAKLEKAEPSLKRSAVGGTKTEPTWPWQGVLPQDAPAVAVEELAIPVTVEPSEAGERAASGAAAEDSPLQKGDRLFAITAPSARLVEWFRMFSRSARERGGSVQLRRTEPGSELNLTLRSLVPAHSTRGRRSAEPHDNVAPYNAVPAPKAAAAEPDTVLLVVRSR